MTASLLFAFTAGAVATVNPCGFALLPVWFAQRLAEGGAAGPVVTHMRALRAGAAATLGFVLIFGFAGLILGLGAAWLGPALPAVGLVVGVAVVLVGFASLTGAGAGRIPGASVCRTISNRHGSLVFGVGYGLLSLSCTLPIFLAAVGVALIGNPLDAGLNLLAYAAGMGTVLTTLGLGAGFTRAGFGSLSQRGHFILRKVTAVLVVAAGVYVTFFWGRIIFGDVMNENALVATGDFMSSLAGGWLGSPTGRWLTGFAFILLVAGIGIGGIQLWWRHPERKGRR
jgi:cytochrome c-type biogenesis protein